MRNDRAVDSLLDERANSDRRLEYCVSHHPECLRELHELGRLYLTEDMGVQGAHCTLPEVILVALQLLSDWWAVDDSILLPSQPKAVSVSLCTVLLVSLKLSCRHVRFGSVLSLWNQRAGCRTTSAQLSSTHRPSSSQSSAVGSVISSAPPTTQQQQQLCCVVQEGDVLKAERALLNRGLYPSAPWWWTVLFQFLHPPATITFPSPSHSARQQQQQQPAGPGEEEKEPFARTRRDGVHVPPILPAQDEGRNRVVLAARRALVGRRHVALFKSLMLSLLAIPSSPHHRSSSSKREGHRTATTDNNKVNTLLSLPFLASGQTRNDLNDESCIPYGLSNSATSRNEDKTPEKDTSSWSCPLRTPLTNPKTLFQQQATAVGAAAAAVAVGGGDAAAVRDDDEKGKRNIVSSPSWSVLDAVRHACVQSCIMTAGTAAWLVHYDRP